MTPTVRQQTRERWRFGKSKGAGGRDYVASKKDQDLRETYLNYVNYETSSRRVSASKVLGLQIFSAISVTNICLHPTSHLDGMSYTISLKVGQVWLSLTFPKIRKHHKEVWGYLRHWRRQRCSGPTTPDTEKQKTWDWKVDGGIKVITCHQRRVDVPEETCVLPRLCPEARVWCGRQYGVIRTKTFLLMVSSSRYARTWVLHIMSNLEYLSSGCPEARKITVYGTNGVDKAQSGW